MNIPLNIFDPVEANKLKLEMASPGAYRRWRCPDDRTLMPCPLPLAASAAQGCMACKIAAGKWCELVRERSINGQLRKLFVRKHVPTLYQNGWKPSFLSYICIYHFKTIKAVALKIGISVATTSPHVLLKFQNDALLNGRENCEKRYFDRFTTGDHARP